MNRSAPERVFLIDSSIYIFKYYFSLTGNWQSRDGYLTNAVYGFTQFLLKFLQAEQPRYVAAAFDESLESGFRHRLSPSYKANRALPDEALAFQLDACQAVSQLLGIKSFASEEYEADDLIGSLTNRVGQEGLSSDILSRDKDLAQLLAGAKEAAGADSMWDYGSAEPKSAADFEAQFGIPMQRLPDYLALVGDTIDSIDGVPGIGAKTAAAILQEFNGVEAILANLDQLADLPVRGAKKLAEKIDPYAEQLRLNLQLTTICTDVSLITSLAELEHNSIDMDGFSDFCREMGLGENLIKKAQKLFDRMLENGG